MRRSTLNRQRPHAAPGLESVWDYPRPPRLERTTKRIRVEFGGVPIADSARAWRVLETSHPPVYYVLPEDVRMDHLERIARTSHCEWKGRAIYYTVRAGSRSAVAAAYAYPAPVEAFEPIRDHIAFYAGPMDRCTVDGEVVRPQEGGFYGGWITADLVGPFKGGPGTLGW
jgi:uncharacterized protein (DUF427 family)